LPSSPPASGRPPAQLKSFLAAKSSHSVTATEPLNSILLGHSAFALGMALPAPFRTLDLRDRRELDHLDHFVGFARMAD
jgi:hypothetical protein